MKTKSTIRILLSFFLSAFIFQHAYAQQDVYANLTTDSSSDMQHAYKISDNDKDNYAYISNLLSLLSTSYVRVRFPVSAQAGDVVNFTVQGTGQVLGVSLLNSITVKLYDSSGNLVSTGTGSSVLQLSLLTNAGNKYALRYYTNPTQNFRFKEARLELNNFLTANLLNQFRIYNAFYQKPCPATLATSVYAYGTNTLPLLAGSVANANNAVDNNVDNYATMQVPLNLLSILPPAYLDLQFSNVAIPGEYVGFTVRQASSLLSLSLLQNISIIAYDASGNQVASQNGFTLANLKLLSGYSDRYMVGFVAPPGAYVIQRVRIVLNGVLNVFEDIDVFNAFHYRPDKPIVSINASGPTNVCAGGSITLTAIDPSGGTNYHWNTGATTQSITVSQSGSYSVDVTDALFCTKYSIPVTVTILPPLQPQIVGDTVLCPGTTGILASAQTYASYKWNDNSTAPTLNISAAGKYFVTITDTNNCVATDTVVVKNNQPKIVSNITASSCEKSPDGAIALNVTEGSGKYGYLWSTGTKLASVNNLVPGLYTCIVIDSGYNCSHTKAFTVAAQNVLTLRKSVVGTTGAGKTDGIINVSVIGGSGNYSYTWSNGATSATVSNLAAGTYYVNITDATAGCGISDTLIIDDANNGLSLTPSVTDATSCGSATGAISVAVTGGSGNYSYKWSNNATTASVSSLVAGNYYVTVTDNTTQLRKSLEIAVSATGVLNVSGVVTNATCNTGVGGIVLNVTSGSGNYTYNWNTGSTTANITGLKPGVYLSTVTDNTTGCVARNTYQVSGSTTTATVTAVMTDCGTNKNASITLGATPAAAKYMWSTGAVTKDVTGLTPGVYTVTITDSLTGCAGIYKATLQARPQIFLNASSGTNTSCLAPFTGSIQVDASEGVIPYTYSWSSGATTPTIANLDGGSYTVTVNDANACTNSIAVTVKTDSSNIVVAVVDSTIKVNCLNVNSGKVYTSATLGTMPYTYAWSNGSTTEDLSGVPVGSYTLTVTDAKGCKDMLTAQVEKVPALGINLTSTNVKCYGNNNGTVSSSVTNGTGNYGYAWSDGSMTANLTGLGKGTYNVTVTDKSTGCTISGSATVNEPAELVSSVTVTTESCKGNDGKIVLVTTGGTAPYVYAKDGATVMSEVPGLGAGIYSVITTDANGCETSSQAIIAKDCNSVINIHDAVTPNGDGSNDNFVIDGIFAYPNSVLQLFNKWGDMVYQRKGYDNSWNGADKNGNQLPAGTYYYILKLNAPELSKGKDTYTGFIMVQR